MMAAVLETEMPCPFALVVARRVPELVMALPAAVAALRLMPYWEPSMRPVLVPVRMPADEMPAAVAAVPVMVPALKNVPPAAARLMPNAPPSMRPEDSLVSVMAASATAEMPRPFAAVVALMVPLFTSTLPAAAALLKLTPPYWPSPLMRPVFVPVSLPKVRKLVVEPVMVPELKNVPPLVLR